MQTMLIYNPQAGITSKPGPDEILDALNQIGFDPAYHPTPTEEDLDQALAEARDLVVVAGGDGTVRAVATRLLGREVKITPLPLGTANNIARMLELSGNPLELIAGLADPSERDLDLGRVLTPQGPAYFLEAMGVGLFADGLKRYRPEDGKSITRSIQSTIDTLRDYQPKFFHVNVDGEDFSGSYLLCEVMNTPTVGLRYMLAPNAKTDDGLFDLVLVHASQRENYLKFMLGVLTGNLENMPEVSTKTGSRLELAWRGFPLHLDGEVLAGSGWLEEEPPEPDVPSPLDVTGPYLHVELIPQAIHLLVPKNGRVARNDEPV